MPRINDDSDSDIEFHLKEHRAEKKSKQPPRKSSHPCQKLWLNFNDYSENTTIHGIKYMGERHRSVGERLWWVIGFVLCVCSLGYFMYAIYVKWEKSPVILAQDEKPTMIYKIPFPAVTLCVENKVKMDKFNYTDTYVRLMRKGNITDEEKRYFGIMSQICEDRNFAEVDGYSVWENEKHMSLDDVKTMIDLAPTLEETFLNCVYDGVARNCSDIFTEIITEDGLCFTFNIVNEMFRENVVQDDYRYFDQPKSIKNWDMGEGYLNGDIEESYPIRTYMAGFQHSLGIMIKSKIQDQNILCRGSDEHKVTLHYPTVYPQPYKNYVGIPGGQYTDIELKPKMIITDDELKSYQPQRRQCYYNRERQLTYFDAYNEENCRLECIANLTLEWCGCIKFSVPRAKGVPVCGPSTLNCLTPLWSEAENLVAMRTLEEEYPEGNDKFLDDIKLIDKCHCLPECTSIDYDMNKYTRKFDVAKYFNTYKIDLNFEPDTEVATMFTVYFPETKFMATKRNELYGISDLISNFGGLLGLFMGGSILSLVEIIYFCTIRRCCARSDDENV